MPKAALEERIAALEDSVRELQVAMRGRQSSADWLDKVIGSLKDEPAFEEGLADECEPARQALTSRLRIRRHRSTCREE